MAFTESTTSATQHICMNSFRQEKEKGQAIMKETIDSSDTMQKSKMKQGRETSEQNKIDLIFSIYCLLYTELECMYKVRINLYKIRIEL